MLQDKLESEDDYDNIFERSDNESEDDDKDSYENINVEHIGVNIETNANELTCQ